MIPGYKLRGLLAGFCGFLAFFAASAQESLKKQTLRGKVAVIIEDDFKAGKSTEEIFIESTRDRRDETVTKRLSFTKIHDPRKLAIRPQDLRTGDDISVTGYESGPGDFVVESLTLHKRFEEKRVPPSPHPHR